MLSHLRCPCASLDRNANTQEFLEHENPGFKSIVGDDSTRPRRCTADACLQDSASCRVEGCVWYEYISNDAAPEARWAQRQNGACMLPQALVARTKMRNAWPSAVLIDAGVRAGQRTLQRALSTAQRGDRDGPLNHAQG